MSEAWIFDPLKDRIVMPFDEFEEIPEVRKAIADMEATPIGSRIIRFIRQLEPSIALDEDMPFFGMYVPYEHNLEPWRTHDINLYDEDTPLLMIDPELLEDKAFLPYMLGNLFFRCVQDKLEEEKRTLPMFQHSVVYNPVVCLGDKKNFVKEYAAMERACDVVSLAIAYQMSRMNRNKTTFGTMLQQEHTKDICSWMTQTGAFIESTGMGRSSPEMAEDLLLFMGNFGGLQSGKYNKDLVAPAERAFGGTINNEGFKQMDIQMESALTPFNSFQFSLLSATYANREWDPNDWVIAVNTFLAEEQKDRAFRIEEAFRMAADARKDEWIKGGDEPTMPKSNPKGPKPPKR